MPASRRGFTLIEILMVMGIIITLTALLTMGLMGARDKAKNKGTKALISKIKIALESYHADFRDYPPDGFDLEPGWDDPAWNATPMGPQHDVAQGIRCGTPGLAGTPQQYWMKNTSALMYFLCTPLIKVTYVGADINDPRNMVKKKVGPYMELTPSDYSMGPRDRPSDGEKEVFNPAHNWADTEYWDTMLYRNCEIVDAYGRPLVYDKVKTAAAPYWLAARVQGPNDPAQSLGINVHPDQELLENFDLLYENEPEYFIDAESDHDFIRDRRFDPRFRVAPPGSPALFGNDLPGNLEPIFIEGGTGTVPVATDATHAPQYSGGYDLWSMGRSWVDPRDDVKSWSD